MSYENFLRAYNQSKSWLRPWSLSLEILRVTISPGHAYPRGFAFFFLLGFLFPIPWRTERDNSPPPGLLMYHT